MHSRYRLPLGILMVATVVVSLYWPGLGGGFFFDDEANILLAEGIRMEALSVSALWEAMASGGAGPSGRPVAQLSFALNHYFSGFDPFAFKATNLAIHIASSWLVFLLARRLLGATLAAGTLATLWLIHPIQLLPVLYVVQRMASLSALFIFGAMLAHMLARERGGPRGAAWLALAWGVLWPLSFLSKETGLLFPFFVLAWELTLRRHAVGGLDRFARILSAGAALSVAAGLAYGLSSGGQWLWAGYGFRPFTLVERLLTEGRVLWLYLGLIAFPRLDAFGLYHDGISLSTGFLDPWTTLPAWAGLAGLAWLGWRLRIKAPVAAFGIAWFLTGHALESTVLPLEIAHEHRNYVPLFGFLLAAASGFGQLMDLPGISKGIGAFFLTVFIGHAGFVTLLRSHQFGEEVRRTQIEAQHHPASARAHYEAGRALALRAGSISKEDPVYFFIRSHYEQAGERDPGFKLGWLGLIHLDCLAGETVDRGAIGELSRRLRETPFAPGDRTLLDGVKAMAIAGTLCLDRADVEALFSSALGNPTAAGHVRAVLHSWLADYLALGARDLPAAERELDRSLALAPYNPSNRLKRAQLAFLQGRRGEAHDILNALRGAPLSRSERGTLARLLDCLNGRASGCGE